MLHHAILSILSGCLTGNTAKTTESSKKIKVLEVSLTFVVRNKYECSQRGILN